MQFTFRPLRATQAAAVLVRMAGGRLNYTKLLKLLYLADRRALVETGTTVTGDTTVNMTNGPVLSALYDCVKGQRQDCQTWNRVFRKDNYDVELVGEVGDDELSDYHLELLQEIHTTHLQDEFGAMIKFVHELPEWEAPADGKSSPPLDPKFILEKAGVDASTLASYEAMNDAVRQVESARIVRC